jgi:hypothetical protein
LYQHPVFFNELDADCFVVSENWILTTAFNRAHTGKAQTRGYDSLPDMFSCIESIVKQGRKKQYIYAYWSQFDHLSHKHGNQSDEVAAHYSVLQQETEKMLKHIQGSNTLLLLSADHGFIDTSPQHCITVNEHARLQNCLSQPLSGEPRAAYCYVHEAKRHEFVDYMNTHFAMQLDCIPSAALLQQNVFGLGEAHPKLHQRIGDFTLIMKDNFIIKDWLESENYFFHYGVHGGVSELEMYVPLVLLEA